MNRKLIAGILLAIAAVLVDAGARDGTRAWLTLDDIVARIAECDLYRRGDGAHPPRNQIAARVHQYPSLFDRRQADSTEIRLRSVG